MKLRRFYENESEYFVEFNKTTVQFDNIKSRNEKILSLLSTRESKFLSIPSLSSNYNIFYRKEQFLIKKIQKKEIKTNMKIRRISQVRLNYMSY